MHTSESIELIIEGLELLYIKNKDMPYYKEKLSNLLEYWHYQRGVNEIIKQNDASRKKSNAGTA